MVKWSFPHGRDASSHILVQISVSSPELLTFIRNSRWRRPPSWIVRLCVFGHSGVLIVWYLCSVPYLVEISVIVTEILTYASDLNLMTSRELTSGLDFWSRCHLCMAVMHFPMKLVHISLSNPELLIFFSEIKDGGRRHLGFVWVSHGTTHEASFVARTSC